MINLETALTGGPVEGGGLPLGAARRDQPGVESFDAALGQLLAALGMLAPPPPSLAADDAAPMIDGASVAAAADGIVAATGAPAMPGDTPPPEAGTSPPAMVAADQAFTAARPDPLTREAALDQPSAGAAATTAGDTIARPARRGRPAATPEEAAIEPLLAATPVVTPLTAVGVASGTPNAGVPEQPIAPPSAVAPAAAEGSADIQREAAVTTPGAARATAAVSAALERNPGATGLENALDNLTAGRPPASGAERATEAIGAALERNPDAPGLQRALENLTPEPSPSPAPEPPPVVENAVALPDGTGNDIASSSVAAGDAIERERPSTAANDPLPFAAVATSFETPPAGGPAAGLAPGRTPEAAAATPGSAPAPSAPAPAMTERTLPELAERIQVLVRDGVQEARIRLDPPDLGEVEIRLTIADGKLQVDVRADQGATRDAFAAALPELRQALEARQLSPDRIELSFGDTGGSTADSTGGRARDNGGDDGSGSPRYADEVALRTATRNRRGNSGTAGRIDYRA